MHITMTAPEGSEPGMGACALIEYEGKRVLLDCGYPQRDERTPRIYWNIPAPTRPQERSYPPPGASPSLRLTWIDGFVCCTLSVPRQAVSAQDRDMNWTPAE